VQAVQEDQVLQPFIRPVLMEAVASLGKGDYGTAGETGGDELFTKVVAKTMLAAAKLNPAEQQAFAAERDNQLREAGLLLAQAGSGMQEAAVQAFSRTFVVASLLMLPGILFALLSDKRPKKVKQVLLEEESPAI
jgi:hypothetical protein